MARGNAAIAPAAADTRGASIVESQIDAFVGKYSAPIGAQLRDARQRLRSLFPRGFELVFDNYNALVFGLSATERTSDGFLSVAAYPKWITLFFLHGASLDDPKGLLEGQGKQVRSIRLKEAADIDAPEVRALIAQATLPHAKALDEAPPLRTLVKWVVAKQRPRRPAASGPTAGRSGAAKRPDARA